MEGSLIDRIDYICRMLDVQFSLEYQNERWVASASAMWIHEPINVAGLVMDVAIVELVRVVVAAHDKWEQLRVT